MKKRRKSREIALQGLYALEISKNAMGRVLDDVSQWGKEDPEIVLFASTLIKRTQEHQSEMDAEVASAAQNWELERIALIDRLILRMALCELLYFEDIPPKVTINEAIDLAKIFSTDQSGRFVNGILDSLYNKYKSEKMIVKKGRGLIE